MPGARPVRSAASTYARGLLAAVVLLMACAGPATADEPFRPPRPPIDQQAEIIDNFYNPSGVPVHLRRGFWNAGAPNAGFGWEKIRGKHQVSNMGVVRQMVHAPGRIYENPPGSNRWIHEHIARRFPLWVRLRRGRTGDSQAGRRLQRLPRARPHRHHHPLLRES
jgi:hypothetical protein